MPKFVVGGQGFFFFCERNLEKKTEGPKDESRSLGISRDF